jgi:hypothetical protein
MSVNIQSIIIFYLYYRTNNWRADKPWPYWLNPDLEKESVVEEVSETFETVDSDGRLLTINKDEFLQVS